MELVVLWGFINFMDSLSTKKIGEKRKSYRKNTFAFPIVEREKLKRNGDLLLLATPIDLCKTYLFINIFQSVGLLGGARDMRLRFSFSIQNIGQKIERVKQDTCEGEGES
jgi:hypothetical protein